MQVYFKKARRKTTLDKIDPELSHSTEGSTEREPVEEMKENRPKGVNEIQWAVLCGYWESDEGKKNAKQILKVEGSKLLTDT